MDRKRQTDQDSESRTASSDLVVRQGLVAPTAHGTTSGDFLDQTISIWQPRADRSLTREDAREIVHNVVGFFRVLQEWAEEDRHSNGLLESQPLQANGVGADSD